MATEWKSQQADGMFYLQFETDNKEKYMLVEKAAQMAIDGKTTADYTDVVRCKDCKYGEHCYPCKAKEEEALEGWYCNIFRGWRSPDDYCSYGKQKPNLSTIPTGSEGSDT